FVLPIELIVVGQIGPAVIYTDVSAREFVKRNAGSKSQPRVSLLRAKIFAGSDMEYVTVVVPAADFKVRRTKHVHAQLRQQFRRSFQTNAHQQAVLMCVTEDRLVDCVTALFLSIDYFKTERCFGNTVDLAYKVTALIVKKGFPISDAELQVADLWRVDGWV